MNEQKMLQIVLISSKENNDINMRDQLVRHLSSLLQEKRYINLWHEGQIVAGENKDTVVSQHLKAADIILLLISIDFLSSCHDRVQPDLKLGIVRRARIIPVILRPCIWEAHFLPNHPLPLPANGKSVVEWEIKDNAYKNIVQGIRAVISDLEDSKNSLPSLDPLVTIASPDKSSKQPPSRGAFYKEPRLQEERSQVPPVSFMEELKSIPPSESGEFPKSNDRFMWQRRRVIFLTFLGILLLILSVLFIILKP